jgi:toxin YoeB
VVSWNLVYTKQAQKDAKKLASSNLQDKAQALLNVIQSNPLQNPPPYEKLVGDLEGAYSRRINCRIDGVITALQELSEMGSGLLQLCGAEGGPHQTDLGI